VPAIFGEWAPYLVEAAGGCGRGRREAGTFDVVLCQAALMFFPDRVAALREMARVTAAGGTVAVQVWDRLEAQEGYGPLTDVLLRHVRTEIEATPLAGRLVPAAERAILGDAREALRPFTTADGRLELPIRGHLLVARR
jgi:SAM-dependent methyltransferase